MREGDGDHLLLSTIVRRGGSGDLLHHSRRLVSAPNLVSSTRNHCAASISHFFTIKKPTYLLIPDRPSRYFLTFHFLSTLGRRSTGRATPPGFRCGPSLSLLPPAGRRECYRAEKGPAAAGYYWVFYHLRL